MNQNPLAIAIQGLGFAAAMVALQGLLSFVTEEVRKHEAGGGIKTRRRVVGMSPTWVDPWEEDEALLLAGII